MMMDSRGDDPSSGSPSKTSSFSIHKNLRGLFAGAGSDGISQPDMVDRILDLLPPDTKSRGMEDVNVLYLGTASYDIAAFRDKQTKCFVDRGCTVGSLDVALAEADPSAMRDCILSADVIVVGGGNTLYAIDRWNHLGLVPHLRSAMENGCVLTGGSAGAICWFDSGHSDSADPETYVQPMLEEHAGENNNSQSGGDESSAYDKANKKEWKYLRVSGLGFVPGPVVCCPHHDRVQSNGLLRANDFDSMLLGRARSSSKSVLGIGIDHFAAFLVEGNNYKVYALPGKAGSVASSGSDGFAVAEDGTATGTPGVWIKRVIVASSSSNKSENDDGNLVVEAMVCPPEGTLEDLLAYGGDNLDGGDDGDDDDEENQEAIDRCRRENPSGMLLP